MRIAIQAEATRLHEIDWQSLALEQELADEYKACADSWAISSEAFLRRKLSEQAHLNAQRVTVSEEVSRLRRKAVAAYGSQHVLENAADAFRAVQRRRQARAEQREADDLGAARMVAPSHTKAEPALPRLAAR
ncbi:hypothetical protein [Alteriqipengyuania lutimaris]|nr:hypothetical protein [Alteriqipengyuania lutimaris]MBB3032453.1 hypothetical protein [Alteriqipengyuania lutimaris]